MITEGLQRDFLSGGVYILLSRDRVRAKVSLQWDGTGLWIYAKRLDRGRSA